MQEIGNIVLLQPMAIRYDIFIAVIFKDNMYWLAENDNFAQDWKIMLMKLDSLLVLEYQTR